ncbi:carboxypeptidase-like regulatory domain-containing protein [Hymenobacter sp. BT664]|uniref:Carboxypeptidase-like regulatory domain-containing protein n=1 Tax=Hymenobacter montanus TaxID=2771359 RepID=A0A927BB74_9BACT|nr:carboxypeptidase-like regulatory domain-containing protein [Hymenobacter montanus]MBD2766923.1 carboxypeptidase-like regulatory domain-containing protein [Hymenobacter montanus]
MKLTASPFNPTTGELLPVYRDAYLRGDLSHENTVAVEAYLKSNRSLGNDTLRRFHDMKQDGEHMRPVGWVQRQMDLIRTEPKRFRQRAAALVMGAVLVAGASMATTHVSNRNLVTNKALTVDATSLSEGELAEASSEASARTVMVQGRILDENGRPLVGATVIDKVSGQGVGTDANGNYSMRLPAHQAKKLQFGYGGYADEEVQVNGSSVQNVTLVPRKHLEGRTKRHRWLFF